MSMKAHINSLYTRHKQLEEEIRDAYLHHRSTSELKKKKLQLKDEIQLFEERMQHSDMKKAA
jgi:hypothetical protein